MIKINVNELKNVNNNQQTDKQYLEMYLKYSKIFLKYISTKLNLQAYEEKINNSGYNFNKVQQKNMDIYQYLSSEELNYFYIRNNLHIERLNEEEIKKLNEIEINTNQLGNSEIEFIEKTYMKVIYEGDDETKKGMMTFFGPTTTKFMARNDSLVLGFRYDDYYANNLSDEQWIEQRDKQLKLILSITNQIINEKKVENPISIIKYDSFSVNQRNDYKEER